MHYVDYLDEEYAKSKKAIQQMNRRADFSSSYHIRVPIKPEPDMFSGRVTFLAHKAQRTSVILCCIYKNGLTPLFFSDFEIVVLLSNLYDQNPDVGRSVLKSLKAYIEGQYSVVKFIIGDRLFSFDGMQYLEGNDECDWKGHRIPVNAMIATLNLILEKENLDKKDDGHVSTAIKLLLGAIYFAEGWSDPIKESIRNDFPEGLDETNINASGKKKMHIKKSDIIASTWYNSI